MLSLSLPSFVKIKSSIIFIINWLQQNWLNILICSLLVYLLVRKNITLQISLENDFLTTRSNKQKPNPESHATVSLANHSKNFNKANHVQLNYIKRFAKVAQGEMHKYGIPASITLAQGLLESGAGRSPLATQNNNHFGIKCFSRKCKKGHCSNFLDDSHKDFFRIYNTAWESYRAHSEFLQGDRYKHLIGETSYKTWANGLASAGYATDRQYGKKLINLIESLELYQYDTLPLTMLDK